MFLSFLYFYLSFAGKDSIHFHLNELKTKTNGESHIQIAVKVAPLHKAYVNQFLVQANSKNLKNLYLSPKVEIMDPLTRQLRSVIQGNATMDFYIDTPKTETLDVKIHYQLCSVRECFFKSSQKLSIMLK